MVSKWLGKKNHLKGNAIRTIDSKSKCKVAKNQRNLAMGR